MIPQRLKDMSAGCSPKQKINLNAADARALGLTVADDVKAIFVTGQELADAIARDGKPAESPEVAATAEPESGEPDAGTPEKPAKKK